jgi:hypothetical protein
MDCVTGEVHEKKDIFSTTNEDDEFTGDLTPPFNKTGYADSLGQSDFRPTAIS